VISYWLGVLIVEFNAEMLVDLPGNLPGKCGDRDTLKVIPLFC